MKSLSNGVYHYVQLDAYKRLVLLLNLVEPIFRSSLVNEVNHNKKLGHTKGNSLYPEFNKIIINVNKFYL